MCIVLNIIASTQLLVVVSPLEVENSFPLYFLLNFYCHSATLSVAVTNPHTVT